MWGDQPQEWSSMCVNFESHLWFAICSAHARRMSTVMPGGCYGGMCLPHQLQHSIWDSIFRYVLFSVLRLFINPMNTIDIYVTSCYFMVFHGMSSYIMLFDDIWCFIMLYHGISWYIMFYHVRLWYIMICHIISCCNM